MKTSLAPGSQVVTDYLAEAGPAGESRQLGFTSVGYGCTTCIGNSGPLPDDRLEGDERRRGRRGGALGNRNFEGRVARRAMNYLASPPLVVAYALAGTDGIDLDHRPDPLGNEGRQSRST